jgi:hypothetical protein
MRLSRENVEQSVDQTTGHKRTTMVLQVPGCLAAMIWRLWEYDDRLKLPSKYYEATLRLALSHDN